MDGQPLTRNGGRMIDAGSPPILYFLSNFFRSLFFPFFSFFFLRFSVNITFRVSIFFFFFLLSRVDTSLMMVMNRASQRKGSDGEPKRRSQVRQ